MKLGIIGLGFVGTTSLVAFSKLGYEVCGIEKNKIRLDGFKKGNIPFFDTELQEKFHETKGIIFKEKIDEVDKEIKDFLVCVETPLTNSKLDLSVVKKAIEEICNTFDGINIWLRSTTDNPDEIKLLSEKVFNAGNKLFLYPEFMREGSCWKDFFDPAFTILAGQDVDKTLFYEKLKSHFKNTYTCNLAEAITVKIASNAFHALKVTFANELKFLKFADQIDLKNVMEIFSSDTKLNISKKYLSPGEPYSGPCLKKDTLALSNLLSEHMRQNSVINQIDKSNEKQIEVLIQKIVNMKEKNIGFFGLEFKKGSGDIRNSYIIKIIKKLTNKNIFIFDNSVPKRELLNVLGDKYEVLASQDELFQKVDIVFTKFNTNIKTSTKVISLDSL